LHAATSAQANTNTMQPEPARDMEGPPFSHEQPMDEQRKCATP